MGRWTTGKADVKQESKRLLSIDMARSIAMVSMLLGHFVGMSLAAPFRNHRNQLYEGWLFVRSLTAPLFVLLVGVVFVYLLEKNRTSHGAAQSAAPDRFNSRIKKGAVRAVQLICWGFVLHLDLRNISRYLNGKFEQWIFAFHILQCLGVGLLLLIALYYIHRKLCSGVWSLCLLYGIAGTLLLGLFPVIHALPAGTYFPATAHPVIQNMIAGPQSVFPLVPWLSLVLYGGTIGALLAHFPSPKQTKVLAVVLAVVGICLIFFTRKSLGMADYLFEAYLDVSWAFSTVVHIYKRLGMVLVLLSAVMLVDQYVSISPRSIFVRFGQQTLPIYIVHVVVLYGAIFGVGLSSYLRQTMNPWQSLANAMLFLSVFVAGVALMPIFRRLIWKLGDSHKCVRILKLLG